MNDDNEPLTAWREESGAKLNAYASIAYGLCAALLVFTWLYVIFNPGRQQPPTPRCQPELGDVVYVNEQGFTVCDMRGRNGR